MEQTVVALKKIYEHDMDLLILEEFISSKKFARIFLDKLQLSDDYTLHKATHSLSDSDGESDIVLILQYPGKKVALLIEDKIDAQTMPEQSARYYKRGNSGKLRGEYDSYHVILVAPDDYHREHQTDKNAAYEHKVSYESLRDYFSRQNDPRSTFKFSVVDFALKEKKAGYLVQEDKAVTEFWRCLRQFCKENHPHLNMVGQDTPKGTSAVWPEFRTSLGTVKVVYKSQKGVVDLEFPKYGDRTADLRSIIGTRMTAPMDIQKTGRSASVRLADDRWRIDFSRDFHSCRTVIAEVLNAVSTLCGLADTLNHSELY